MRLVERVCDAQDSGEGAHHALRVWGEIVVYLVFGARLSAAMVASDHGDARELIAGPAKRRFEGGDEAVGCLVVSLRGLRAARIVQESGRVQQNARAGHAQRAVEAGGGEAVEEFESEPSHLAGMRRVRIEAGSPESELGERGSFQPFPFGQAGAPDVPEGFAAGHSHAVFVEAGRALAIDGGAPAGGGGLVERGTGFGKNGGEDVEIVDLTEKVLDSLQIVSPFRMTSGQKILDRVAETL